MKDSRLEYVQLKQREAQFFLGHMDTTARDRIPATEETFGYFLSAFLSAAHTLMNCVANGGYWPWLKPWLEAHGALDRKMFMQKQRRLEIHGLGAKVETTATFKPRFSIAEQVDRTGSSYNTFYQGGGDPRYYGFFSSDLLSSNAANWETVRYFKIEGTPVEVVSACWDYAAMLADLVKDFGAAYPNA